MPSIDGVATYGFSGSLTPPNDSTYGGCALYLRNQAGAGAIDPVSGVGANDILLGWTGPKDTTFVTDRWPIHDTEPTWDLYFVSRDVNNQQNKLVPGVTPRVVGLHPVAGAGKLKGNRLDPATLDATLAIFGDKLGVPDTSLAIQKFVNGIRPVLVVTSDPALPDAKYPSGTFEFNTTSGVMNRVNAAGTAWELAIKGGVDIQAGSISGDRLVANTITVGLLQAGVLAASNITAGTFVAGVVYAGQILCSQLVAGTISAAISMTSPTLVIASGGITVNIDSANYMKVSSAGGQSQVLDTTIRTQNSANNRFIQLSSGGQIIGQSVGGTTFSLDANGGLVLQGFPVIAYNYVTIASASGQSQVLDTTIRTQNAANNRYVQLSSGGQIIGQSIGGSTFSLDGNGGLNIQGNQVVGARQTDPGVPAGFADAAAQNWCANLRTALKNHGLI